MKTFAAVLFSLTTSTVALAQPSDQPVGPQPAPPAPAAIPAPAPAPAPEAAPAAAPAQPLVQPALATPSTTSQFRPVAGSQPKLEETETGWHRPSTRLLHGIRLGYNYVSNFDKETRDDDMSLKDELGLKTPHMMVLGYEAMYRIVGQSWLNVVLVGNVSVAGLEQSKFIPAASGLIGAEFNESFQLGIGVNVTPDPQAPTHMIGAVGWTPKVGGIYTPVHFYFVPDTAGNHRSGATVGVTW